MSHLTPLQKLAAGIHSVPGVAQSLATTQAAWRFFSNPNVGLPLLAGPLIEHVRHAIPRACDDHVLVACDWSVLNYTTHHAKARRVTSGGGKGYDLFCALAIGDRSGQPLAPLCLELEDAEGLHTTRRETPLQRASPLDTLAPVMDHVAAMGLKKPPVFLIDREADSVAHYRRWDADGHLFVVRADRRVVRYDGRETTLSYLYEQLIKQGLFTHSRTLLWHDGQEVQQQVAEAAVTLERPAIRNRKVGGKRVRTQAAGRPLRLRLVVSRVLDKEGKELSCWMLMTNVPATTPASTIALWYYWRWRIESCFKLMKEAGQQVEEWQQESARAIASRLLVSLMACTVVWGIDRSEHPQAAEVRALLISLSGRQMKWRKGKGRQTHTQPALMAGLMVLLPMLELLRTYEPQELRDLIEKIVPGLLPGKRG